MATAHEKSGTDAQTFVTLVSEFYRSQRFRGAFKTALAMVIVYGIALYMGWGHTHWGGLAVAMCSLTTTGESLHKGLLRMGGTFVAFFVTLALIALFPQDRWLFLVALSIYLACCNYMMGGTSRWYFWYVAAFVVPILAFGGGPESLSTFNTVVMRTQLTAAGVLSLTLVSTFLWPTSTKNVFEETVSKLAAGQHQLFRKYAAQLFTKGDDENISTLRTQVVQGAGALKGLLNGAEVDSLEVWEVRQAWRHCVDQLAELNTRLDRWRLCFDELQELDIERLVPQLSALTAEVETRFGQIERMLAGQPPEVRPQEISLQLEQVKWEGLSPFQRATIVSGVKQLAGIDALTRAFFETIGVIRGFQVNECVVSSRKARPPLRAFDPDRGAGVLRFLMCVWSAFLIWVFLPDVPAYTAFLSVTISVSLMLMVVPQLPIKMLPKPIMESVLYAAVVHVLIMPHLEGFAQLALLIFGVTFSIAYTYAKPQQQLSRSIGLAIFLVVSGIGTPQVYSFLQVADVSVVLVMIVSILYVATYFPISFRPELRLRHLLKRFFKSCEYLITAGQFPSKPSRLQRWRRAFHLREVMIIPAKLFQWSGVLSADALGKSTPAQMQEILKCVQVLGGYVQELIAVREETGINEKTAHETRDYLRTWRHAIEELFVRLSIKPDAEDEVTLRTALDDMLERLEARIEQTVDASESPSWRQEKEDNGYQLLGVYRGLSEALVAYARSARTVDWSHLAESRF